MMRLAEAGRLDLETPVQEIAPDIEMHNAYAPEYPIRIVHLLEHTSGFDDMRFNELYNLTDPPDVPLREALAVNPRTRTARWQPGTRFSYSNVGYGLAGHVLEEIVESRYEEYLTDKVLVPLGMNRSSFILDDQLKDRLATPYAQDGSPTDYPNIYHRPAGALASTPADMARFVRLLLNNGEYDDHVLLTPESVARIERPQSTRAAQHGLPTGYGLGVISSPVDGFPSSGHDGGIEGFLAEYRYFRGPDLGYAVLTNSGNSRGFAAVAETIREHLLSGEMPPEPPPTAEAPLDEYTGFYLPRSPRIQLAHFAELLFGGMRVYVEQDTLRQSQLLGSSQALVPTSSNQFRFSDQPEPQVIFITDNDGRMAMESRNVFFEEAAAWKQYVYPGAFLIALGLIASSVLYAFWWMPWQFYKKVQSGRTVSPGLRIRMVPLLATLALVASGAFLGIVFLDFATAGAVTMASVAFTISTVLFAVLSVAALVVVLRNFRTPIAAPIRWHALLVSIALVGLTIYFSYWQIIGLRLWQW